MRIGIDFDRVLFRTDDFKRFLNSKIDGFMETYPEGRYNAEEHAERLGIQKGRIESYLERADEFVYDDVSELEELEGHTLVLVTRGDPSFQKKKVEESGVTKYFDEVKIVEDEPKDSANIDFLVDDWKKEIERSGTPGMVFNRDKNSIADIVERVKDLDG